MLVFKADSFLTSRSSITFKPQVELSKPEVPVIGKLVGLNKSLISNSNIYAISKAIGLKPAIFKEDRTNFIGRGTGLGIKRVSNTIIVYKPDTFRATVLAKPITSTSKLSSVLKYSSSNTVIVYKPVTFKTNILTKPITSTSRFSTVLKYSSSNTVNYIYTSSKRVIDKPGIFKEDKTNFIGRGKAFGLKSLSNTIPLSKTLTIKTYIPTVRPFVKTSVLLAVPKKLSSNTYNLIFTSSKNITFRVVPVMTMALTGGSNTLPTGAGTSIQQLWYTD